MLCHHCGNDMQLGQRVCPTCGAADDVVPARAGPAEFTIVEQTEPVVLPGSAADLAAIHARQRQAADATYASVAALTESADGHVAGRPSTADAASQTIRPWTGSTLLAVLAVLTAIAAIAGSFLLISTITSDAPIPQYLGDYGVNDLGAGTNFQVAFLVVGALLLLGALLVTRHGPVAGTASSGQRLGAGLIAGASLALIPVVAFAWSSADAITDRALQQAESISSAGGGGQVFESTLGAGFFVVIGAGVAALITLIVALGASSDDGRPPLGTAICVVGAIGCLTAAVGQLIPERGARLIDNISNDFNSAPHIYSRVGMIAVVAIGGVLGFLLASRFGLGLAVGATSIYVWQWISSIIGAGDYPAPPALGNPGNIDGKPHLVTTIGLVLAVLMAGAVALTVSHTDRSPS